MENMKEKEVGSSFHDNLAWMDQHLPVEASFDLIKREIEIGGRNAAFYFIDGFMKDEASGFHDEDQTGRYAGENSGVFGKMYSICGSGNFASV